MSNGSTQYSERDTNVQGNMTEVAEFCGSEDIEMTEAQEVWEKRHNSMLADSDTESMKVDLTKHK